ncbi:MAG: hypothetical protein V3U82_07785 [Robiginitomaculum sp.]
MAKVSEHEFIGYDLGHGETALGRAYSNAMREPEILEYRGQRTFVTAVAQSGGATRIGAEAVNIAALQSGKRGEKAQVWVKFKDRDQSNPDVIKPTQLFTKALLADLEAEKKIKGAGRSDFIIGCPSGWDIEDRARYKAVFEGAGLKSVTIAPESRAALMTALEQGYLSLEAARSSVLIVDIGSSTTDFTYCQDMGAEDVGHNVLGSGLLDGLIFERNMARQKDRKKIEKLIKRYPHYRPIMEYWCRLAKEQYFNGDDLPVEMIRRLPVDGGALFEIRIDKVDAAAILRAKLTALNGYSWPKAFDFALRETIEQLGGRAPQTILLTGGASRLPLIAPACEKAFPSALVVRGAEPEFAIARGLAWLGRFEYLHASFKTEVGALIADGGTVRVKAQKATADLGDVLSPVLVDALLERCVIPAFRDWRSGKIDTLDAVEEAMELRVKTWLNSDDARDALRPVISEWFAALQRNIEKDTDPLCREHGLPAMVLSLDDSAHVARHLEDMSVSAPKLAKLEQDTALAGTTISAILIGVILAKMHLLLPLLANPIGIAIGGALGAGGVIFGRKALEGKMRRSNVPVIARKLMTDRRLRSAASGQRAAIIASVQTAWKEAASERFSRELTDMLSAALIERTDERAVLFLI